MYLKSKALARYAFFVFFSMMGLMIFSSQKRAYFFILLGTFLAHLFLLEALRLILAPYKKMKKNYLILPPFHRSQKKRMLSCVSKKERREEMILLKRGMLRWKNHRQRQQRSDEVSFRRTSWKRPLFYLLLKLPLQLLVVGFGIHLLKDDVFHVLIILIIQYAVFIALFTGEN